MAIVKVVLLIHIHLRGVTAPIIAQPVQGLMGSRIRRPSGLALPSRVAAAVNQIIISLYQPRWNRRPRGGRAGDTDVTKLYGNFLFLV